MPSARKPETWALLDSSYGSNLIRHQLVWCSKLCYCTEVYSQWNAIPLPFLSSAQGFSDSWPVDKFSNMKDSSGPPNTPGKGISFFSESPAILHRMFRDSLFSPQRECRNRTIQSVDSIIFWRTQKVLALFTHGILNGTFLLVPKSFTKSTHAWSRIHVIVLIALGFC